MSKRPGNYQKSCGDRSCNKDLSLKCIDSICDCTDTQCYLNGCYEKRSIGEICAFEDQCKYHLSCIGGRCLCNDTHYHMSGKCLLRKTYQDPCQGDQCLTKSMLTCDQATSKCVCLPNRYAAQNYTKINLKKLLLKFLGWGSLRNVALS